VKKRTTREAVNADARFRAKFRIRASRIHYL